jgi:hypothetical protein
VSTLWTHLPLMFISISSPHRTLPSPLWSRRVHKVSSTVCCPSVSVFDHRSTCSLGTGAKYDLDDTTTVPQEASRSVWPPC